MARKGTLPPGKKLEPFMADGKTPRCQGIRFLEGKKHGVQCSKAGMRGRQYCRSHGGKSGRPVETGVYSKHAPLKRGLEERFNKAKDDPSLLDLSKKIAMVEAEIDQMWDEIKGKEKLSKDESQKFHSLMRLQMELIGKEVDRRIAVGNLMKVEEVMQIIQYMYVIVNKHVPDQTTKAKIGAELRMIVKTPLQIATGT
jgi:hypothetical protein